MVFLNIQKLLSLTDLEWLNWVTTIDPPLSLLTYFTKLSLTKIGFLPRQIMLSLSIYKKISLNRSKDLVRSVREERIASNVYVLVFLLVSCYCSWLGCGIMARWKDKWKVRRNVGNIHPLMDTNNLRPGQTIQIIVLNMLPIGAFLKRWSSFGNLSILIDGRGSLCWSKVRALQSLFNAVVFRENEFSVLSLSVKYGLDTFQGTIIFYQVRRMNYSKLK